MTLANEVVAATNIVPTKVAAIHVATLRKASAFMLRSLRCDSPLPVSGTPAL